VDSESVQDQVKATSFAELYAAYARDVYRFSFYLSGDRALAQDIAAETFLRVWLAEQPVRPISAKAWLFTIARNLYRHELRHIRPKLPLDPAMPSAESVLATVELKEELASVNKALGGLPEVDRSTLLLRVVEGLPYEEIASIMQISVAAAKVKVHRARLYLARESRGGIANEHLERRHS